MLQFYTFFGATMELFNSPLHTITPSADGSFTAYSSEFGQHYHSTSDGALQETLYKHIIPAYSLQKEKQELHILDICFGLGYNTLATVLYYKKHAPHVKLFIYTPEFDTTLISSLASFSYPQEFTPLLPLLQQLITHHTYRSDFYNIELFLGDAREYIQKFHNHFDIVYQDAFSPQVNPDLWSVEYFGAIKRSMKSDGILTTYSTALPVRLALHKHNFYIYLQKNNGMRDSTIASLTPLEHLQPIDMDHKIQCNPHVKPIFDTKNS
jgi:tRNA U34 5-methylaminomethyl-2-thiouridine-forming methyltransferase MnmC